MQSISARTVVASACWAVLCFARPDAAAAQGDGVTRLLAKVERAFESNDRANYLALLSPAADRDRAQHIADNLLGRNVTRAVIRERDRSHLTGTLPGNGYEVLAEGFIESGRRARIVALRLDVKMIADDEWAISDQEVLTSLEGLYRLSLSPDKQFTATNLTVLAEDFQLTLPSGSVFVSETDEGVTGVLLLGRGDMTFTPTPPTERGQIKLIAGSEVLQTKFEAAFLRVNPADFADRVSRSALAPRRADARDFKRADEIFREEVPKSFGLELSDLSRESWSLMPPIGDFLAEVRTRKYDTLTYARSGSEPEDITLFDRQRHRNLAVYASKRTLSTRGRFYSEDDLADYDVLDYQVDATFSPDRDWVEGQVTMKVKIKAPALNTVSLRLADPLTVQSITSREFGRLMGVRVRNQNSIVVNFPSALLRDTPVTLTVVYAGRLPAQTAEREAIAASADQVPSGQRSLEDTSIVVPPEPSYLYSNRSYWYPQAPVTDYATATLRLTVPASYTCVASGEVSADSPVIATKPRGEVTRTYTYVARQPVRYLAAVISRFVRVDSSNVSLKAPTADNPSYAARPGANVPGGGVAPADGPATDSVRISIEANPRQQSRGRDLSQRAADIIRFYSSVIGDCPYPSFTIALVENTLPGGHSPAYFAALNQPLPSSPFTWRNDPTSFNNYPDFFLAHELAHQWWGQAVGWKNFHEQWLSEGFAQYFAALYARQQRGQDVFDGIIRQLRRTSVAESDQGPVHLGYRLGHVKGDSRIFRALVYNKGAAVLHMLRRLIGDDAFFNGLRRFYSTWRFQKASTEDVRAAFEKESGRPLERFFEQWIYGSDIPRIRYSITIENGGGEGAALIRFEQLNGLFELPVTITITSADGQQRDVIVPISDRVVEHRIPLGAPIRGIELNADDAALAEFVK